MSALLILTLSLLGLAVNLLKPGKALAGIVLVLSALSLYWLQPLTPIRNLDYWLPTLSIGLTILVWAITYPGEKSTFNPALPGLPILLLVILGISANRYLFCCITASTPPHFYLALLAVSLILLACLVAYFLLPENPSAIWITIGLLLALFIALKSEPLSQSISAWLRRLTGQSPELAAPADLTWLGFSFIAFRLLHTIRDYQMKRLPSYTLVEFASYVLFFPAVISGPIDRSQHFINELRNIQNEHQETAWKERTLRNLISGAPRILIGAFKKFVLADSLALLALNAQNAVQTTSTGWTWILLLAYSLRIYFDFSGYTDIAIGLARLMGVALPENFDRPYSKENLTAFWNSWHITLAQWFRTYIFYPFTRAMRTKKNRLPAWSIILAAQFLTMSLIGIWHGITLNFFLWGAWHGLGLFAQNRWSDWIHPRLDVETLHPMARFTLRGGSWLATFIFVSLGWVWFALPSPQLSLSVFARLAGAAH